MYYNSKISKKILKMINSGNKEDVLLALEIIKDEHLMSKGSIDHIWDALPDSMKLDNDIFLLLRDHWVQKVGPLWSKNKLLSA